MDWRTASSVPPVIVAMTSTSDSKNLLRSFMGPTNSSARSKVFRNSLALACFLARSRRSETCAPGLGRSLSSGRRMRGVGAASFAFSARKGNSTSVPLGLVPGRSLFFSAPASFFFLLSLFKLQTILFSAAKSLLRD